MSTTTRRVCIRDLDRIRPSFAKALQSPRSADIRVEVDGTPRFVDVSITPDGVSSWLLKISGPKGRVLFDCRGMGVSGLTDERLCFMVVRAFRVLDQPEVKPS
jgi:hypothetical protein